MDAISHEKLFLAYGDFMLPIQNLMIHEELSSHGKLAVNLAVEPETKDYLLYEGDGRMSVSVVIGDAVQVLFCGIVVQMEAQTVGRQCIVHAELMTESYRMDISPVNRVFQDMEMTSHQLAEKVMENYPQSRIEVLIPNEPLQGIVVQYQETDWTFLNRFFSAYEYRMGVAGMMPFISLWAKRTQIVNDIEWDSLPYMVFRNTAPAGRKRDKKGNVYYQVKTYEIRSLGEKVRFHGQELYIGKIVRDIRNGLLTNTYDLFFEEGIKISQYYNPFLGGVSVNGTVSDIKRNKIQAFLEYDALAENKSSYTFPYSTVAASSDGSGWYCMPKAGDRIRIFFPTEDEREGYAIANIAGDSAPAEDSPMSNPDGKDIVMPDGKALKFVDGGIQLAVGEGKGVITLINDGQLDLRTEQDIEIGAGNEIIFDAGEEGTATIAAGTEIKIESDANGSICITGDTVEIKGNIIESN